MNIAESANSEMFQKLTQNYWIQETLMYNVFSLKTQNYIYVNIILLWQV